VVVVSDYAGPGAKDWADERAILEAFGAQDLAESFEIVLVEHERYRSACPDWLTRLAPRTTVHFAAHEWSSRLKDAAVPRCAGTLIAVVEADSVPAPDWLRHLVAAMDADPGIDAASGRTTYGGGSALRRVLGVLDRGWMDPGRPGAIEHLSNNGALYRRALLERFPYPAEPNAFLSARLRNRAMLDAGARLYFEPRAVMEHGFGGLGFEMDMRRNVGFADGRLYLATARPPRSTPRALATLIRRRLAGEWLDCRRLGPQYLRWYDWPLALCLLGCVRLFELPGALAALRGAASLPRTSYR